MHSPALSLVSDTLQLLRTSFLRCRSSRMMEMVLARCSVIRRLRTSERFSRRNECNFCRLFTERTIVASYFFATHSRKSTFNFYNIIIPRDLRRSNVVV